MTDLHVLTTEQLAPADLRAIRALLDAAFEGTFSDEDWEHTLGGTHVLLTDGSLVSHASVVERSFVAGGIPLRVGYVEGVATSPAHRRKGHASAVMKEANRVIRSNFQLGCLSTDVSELYLSVEWEHWQGPTYVASPTGRMRTADEDGGIMVLRTPATSELDPASPLICDWRTGDVW